MKKYILLEVETDLTNARLRECVEDALLTCVPDTNLTQRPKVNAALPGDYTTDQTASAKRKVALVEMDSMVSNEETRRVFLAPIPNSLFRVLQATVMDANL